MSELAANTREALAGKVVVITGASRGIGAEMARLAGSARATVVLIARDDEALEQVAEDVRAAGGRAACYVADLSDLDGLDALAARILDDHGGVDWLIHNAARSIRRLIAESLDRFHDYERTMTLNYFAPVRLTLALLPSLRERRGRVGLVLTMGVLIPGPHFSAYLASKAALGAFGDSLAAEFHDQGLRVCSVYLPLVRTEMMAPTKEYAGRRDVMSPRRAARLTLDGLAEGTRRVIPRPGKRYAFYNLYRPAMITRVLNVLHRTFPPKGQSSDYPQLKKLLKKTLGGSPL